MIIAMCCTKNWYMKLQTGIYSLLSTNNVEKIYLFIEDDEIPGLKNNNKIKFININKLENYIKTTSPNYDSEYTKMSFIRCYFSKVLKCSKIIYVDADAIVVNDISYLWNLDLNDNVIAGVHEPGEWNKHLNGENFDDNYINSGVLVMDLDKIREQHLDDRMIFLLNHNRYRFPDQDVINIVCKDKILHLSNIYNSTETTGMVENVKIIHYIRSKKGWIKSSPRSEIWFKWHYKFIESEDQGMKNYNVIATREFDDTVEGVHRIPYKQNYEFKCTAERYKFLKENNAVELVSIEKIEEAVIEEHVIESVKEEKPKKSYKKKNK